MPDRSRRLGVVCLMLCFDPGRSGCCAAVTESAPRSARVVPPPTPPPRAAIPFGHGEAGSVGFPSSPRGSAPPGQAVEVAAAAPPPSRSRCARRPVAVGVVPDSAVDSHRHPSRGATLQVAFGAGL